MKKLFVSRYHRFVFSFSKGYSQQDAKAETSRMMDLLKNWKEHIRFKSSTLENCPAIPLSLMDTIVAKEILRLHKYVWLKTIFVSKFYQEKKLPP